ncbi:MAG TPA: muconolactone Delta-isomerase family protein [Melioribacteraceae bacterium]|nr:muconolactone Delta-isomerase family protein [Melioribacteraceae bacterium]
MKILAIEKENSGVDSGKFDLYSKEEAGRVWELYKEGVIREIYFRTDKNEAVLLLECGDAAEARKILNTLPLVSNGLIDFEIISLKPYPGFERLFAE